MVENRRRGSALVYALATVLLIGGLSASFLQLSTGTSRRQTEGLEKKEAFYLAEAGLTEALVGLGQGRTGNIGSPAQPASFGEGLFWVVASDLGAGLTELECTAKAGGATAKLSIVVEDGTPSVAALGLFGLDALDILPGSLIDAYESSAGPYQPPQPPAQPSGGLLGGKKKMGSVSPSTTTPVMAMVGSGGGVTITGTSELPTMVVGDVFAGPESEVTVSGEVTISGETETLVGEAELPAITVPEVVSGAGLEHSGAYPLVVPPGASGFEFLRVQPHAEVIVQGPATLVLGQLQLEAESLLTLDASGGPIEVYVTEQVQLAPSSSLVVTPEDPTRVSIQVSGEPEVPLELFADATFYGLFYAPQAEVAVASSFEVFGSLVAQHLGFVGPVRLHFDQTLASQAVAESQPSLVSWRIVELENEIGAAGANPYVLLGIDPSLGLPPALAHEDQFLDLQYLDLSQTLQIYQGSEQAFDWDDVSSVVTLTRDGTRVQTVVANVVNGVKGLVGGILPIGP